MQMEAVAAHRTRVLSL
jgi:hypothetical protein